MTQGPHEEGSGPVVKVLGRFKNKDFVLELLLGSLVEMAGSYLMIVSKRILKSYEDEVARREREDDDNPWR